MRKLVVTEFLTLDGVMQGPGDLNEDRSGGFDQGGWQLAFFDDVFGRAVLDGFANAGGFLLGRRTYEIFAAYWPNQPAEDPVAGPLNSLPKHVVSTTLREPLSWQNSNLVSGNVAHEIASLKDQPGKEIQVIGSGELVQTLIRNELVDEYRLMIHPIVLGNGKRLFREGGTPARMRLVDSKTTTTGVLILTYEPMAGAAAAAIPAAATASADR
jgi:dihydrofolate reductase